MDTDGAPPPDEALDALAFLAAAHRDSRADGAPPAQVLRVLRVAVGRGTEVAAVVRTSEGEVRKASAFVCQVAPRGAAGDVEVDFRYLPPDLICPEEAALPKGEPAWFDGALAVRRDDETLLVERAEHDGRRWQERVPFGDGTFAAQLHCSARLVSDADVEGDAAEMLALACAIESRMAFKAKRCAVRVEGDRAALWSPHNSSRACWVPLAVARMLAAEIRRELAR